MTDHVVEDRECTIAGYGIANKTNSKYKRNFALRQINLEFIKTKQKKKKKKKTKKKNAIMNVTINHVNDFIGELIWSQNLIRKVPNQFILSR